ncbi:hypothetical protein HOC01_04140 [archaeon]|jgi:hypothetical protein|nr:hypothetical protein [archaeon]MBT6698397.1 hypothetical protein [archaeon]
MTNEMAELGKLLCNNIIAYMDAIDVESVTYADLPTTLMLVAQYGTPDRPHHTKRVPLRTAQLAINVSLNPMQAYNVVETWAAGEVHSGRAIQRGDLDHLLGTMESRYHERQSETSFANGEGPGQKTIGQLRRASSDMAGVYRNLFKTDFQRIIGSNEWYSSDI